MSVQSIVVLVLRFYAIALLMQAVPELPLFVAFMMQLQGGEWLFLLAPVTYLFFAIVLWWMAGFIASRIVRGVDGQVQFEMKLEQSLTFAFVFLGLYFVLKSIGSAMINVVHLANAMSTVSRDDLIRTRALTDLYRSGITVAVGFGCIFGASNLSHRLSGSRTT